MLQLYTAGTGPVPMYLVEITVGTTTVSLACNPFAKITVEMKSSKVQTLGELRTHGTSN